jgi:hypothetical protein
MSNYNNQPPGNQPKYNFGPPPITLDAFKPKKTWEDYGIAIFVVAIVIAIIVVVAIAPWSPSPSSPKAVLCTQLQKTEQDTLNGASGAVLYADGFTLGTDAQKAGGQYEIDIEEFASAANSGVPMVGNPGLIALENACR